MRLGLPYPITGPREIQAGDRTTRRYRAVAAYAVPPISESIAQLIVQALAVEGHARVIVQRRPGLEAFDANRADAGRRRHDSLHLLLAGDDVVRTEEMRRRALADAQSIHWRLVEPIATMPFVLFCSVSRCAGNGARAAGGVRWPGGRLPRALGTAGETSTSHLGAQLLRARLGLDTLLVAYGGGSGVMSALLGAEVDAAFIALPLALGYVGHPKLRTLGIASAQRHPALPALQTLAEAGIGGIAVEGWYALFTSNELGEAAAAEVGERVRAYRLEPASRAELLVRGLLPVEARAAEFRLRVDADRMRWTELMALPR
jgi:hypothetical protein